MLRYIYDRSKNNQGNLILWAESEDTFMYHNNGDNSIKTPIIARYNTLSGETQTGTKWGEYSVVYLSSYEPDISDISEYNVRFCLNIPQCALPCVFYLR